MVTEHSSLPDATSPPTPTTPKHDAPKLNAALRITQLLATLRHRVKARKARPHLTTDDIDDCWSWLCLDNEAVDEGPYAKLGDTPSFGLLDLQALPTPPVDMALDNVNPFDALAPHVSREASSPCQADRPTLASVVKFNGGDDIFLQTAAGFMEDHTTWNDQQIQAIQSTIRRILVVIQPAPSDASLLNALDLADGQAKDAGLADLDHLLRSLCFDLEAFKDAMNQKIFHKHIQDCQQDETIHRQDWYSIFPDARHPLNTTWPWCIKPSLAVIWGVCWMFYPPWQSGQNLGNQRYPGNRQQQRQQRNQNYHANQLQQQQFPAPMYDPQLYMNSSEQQNPGNGSAAALRMTPRTGGQENQAAGFRAPPRPEHDASRFASTVLHPSQAFQTGPHHSNGPRTPYTEPGLSDAVEFQQLFPESGTTSPSEYTFNDAADTEPTYLGLLHLSTDVTQFNDHYYPPQAQPNLPLLHHRTNQSALSALDTSSTHPPPPGDLEVLRSAPPTTQAANFSDFPSTNPNHLLPPNLMTAIPMQSPISISRSREASRALSPGRPRALSDTSASAHSKLSPQPPVASTPDSRTYDDDGPVSATTPDRPQPAKNAHGQYICTFAQCVNEVFDRKCEWTKHFDKHDRPYKCKDTACSKLQGFTYSGGLLRHQREVHGMHGGPKEKLFCRFSGDCKRKSEKGFTRKENRDEHERRVHNGPFDDAVKEETTSSRGWSEASEIRRASVATGKRKASEASETDIEDLRGEIKRLREDNEELRSQMKLLIANSNIQQARPQQQPAPAQPREQVANWRPANR